MPKNYFKGRYFAVFCIIAFVMMLLTTLNLSIKDTSQLQNKYSMSHSPMSSSNEQPPSTAPSNYQPVTQLSAEEFYFETHVSFPTSVLTNPAQYTESINHHNGALDITLSEQGNAVTYLIQISSFPTHLCESDSSRACQSGAAPARGNIAEIQITRPGHELLPGTYSFRNGESTQSDDPVVYSRQLYSDPAHGRLGCQNWGIGTLNVIRADYDTKGRLEYLEANVVRDCNQTLPLPILPPQDAVLNVEVENIEKYTYQASWRCRFN